MSLRSARERKEEWPWRWGSLKVLNLPRTFDRQTQDHLEEKHKKLLMKKGLTMEGGSSKSRGKSFPAILELSTKSISVRYLPVNGFECVLDRVSRYVLNFLVLARDRGQTMSNDNVRPMDQPKNPNQLERVLLAMLNPQNNIRRAAEKCLETFFENAACVPAMMQQIMSGPDARARQMAAVLLRKRLSVGLWRSSEKHWNATTNGLMRRLVEESVWPVRKAVAALACRVAKLTIPDGKWPQLLGFLVQLSTKPKEELRTVSMLLFRAMGENLGQHMVKHLEKYAKVCVQGLRDPAVRVRVEAFRAMEGVVGYLETKEHVEMYGNLIPLAVKSAQEILKKDADDAAPALELFNTLAESPVPVLEKYLIPLTKFMMEVSVKCENMSLSDTAMRFVQSVVDMKPHRLVRANMIPDVLRAAFYFVSKPDDNPFDPDEVTAQRIGVCMISALVESVPYKHVLNPCLQTSVKLIKSDNPHHKRGGMAIIAAIAEGFSLLLREALPDLLDATLSLIQNKSAMVRVAACVCLLQLCDHIQPDICNHHERLVKAMVTTLDRPGEHPMVRVKMATAMCAFLEGLDPETMAIYIKPLMKKFGQLVTGNESEDMKEMAIGGIMSVAIASEEKFTPFFKDSANALFHFMSKKADEDLKLRARATECMGCVAVAVGKDIFRPFAVLCDCGMMADIYLNEGLNQVFALADENLTLDYFSLSEATFRLYTSLAQCLGEEFCKVLPKVHQYAVKCLESMDGVEIRHQGGDMSAFHQEDVHDEDDMLRQMQYSIRSGAVDEKAAAEEEYDDDGDDGDGGGGGGGGNREIQSMQSFAEFCGRGYLPFIKPTLDICKEMLEYPHEFVRHGVAAVLHEMIKLAHKTFPNPQNSNKMQKSAMAIVMATLPHILEMINVETDKQCCAEAVDAV
eukprot:jgi/Bigna1/69117/fgenesh1_pg.8_\